MNVIDKIFCGVLMKRLQKWVYENSKLTDLQAR